MYQEVCFNRGTEAGEGGGVNVGQSLSPSSHFMLATGLTEVIIFNIRLSTITKFNHEIQGQWHFAPMLVYDSIHP